MNFDKRITRRCIFVLSWLAALFLMDTAFRQLTPAQPGASPGGFAVGIGTHNPSSQALGLIHDAGISCIRDDIRWSEVERTKNELVMPKDYDRFVDEALRRGIKPLLILCYGNRFYDDGLYPESAEAIEGFARFAEFVVGHFKDRVQYYEVWNEWNVGTGLPDDIVYGDPARYVALLKKVYPRLKLVDPAITVIGGAISGNGSRSNWMETACENGLLDSADALSYHPYCYGAPGDERLPEIGLVSRIRQNEQIMRRYQKGDMPVFLTELGWPTHEGQNGSSPRDEARFLARSFLVVQALPFIKGMWWYDFRDDGLNPGDPEENYGIVANSLAPKPAYGAMRDVCRLFAEARYSGEVDAGPGIRIMKFSRVSGGTLWVAWSLNDAEGWEATFTVSVKDQGSRTAVPPVVMGSQETAGNWEQKAGFSTVTVKLTGMPLVIDTGNAGVQVAWRR